MYLSHGRILYGNEPKGNEPMNEDQENDLAEAMNFLTHEIEHGDEKNEWSLGHIPGGFLQNIAIVMQKYVAANPFCPHCDCKKCNPLGIWVSKKYN